MRLKLVGRIGAIAALAMAFVLAGSAPAHGQSGTAPMIPSSALMQPQALNQILHEKGTAKPLILQVGFSMMYREAHIVGAKFAGPAAQVAGQNMLRATVEKLNRSTPIVIYCGCCPWNHCPNMWPAYQLLHGMGFTNVKALYLPDNFGTDWVSKGYAVDRP